MNHAALPPQPHNPSSCRKCVKKEKEKKQRTEARSTSELWKRQKQLCISKHRRISPPPPLLRPHSDGRGDALPLKPDRCTKMDARTPCLLFADRFCAVPQSALSVNPRNIRSSRSRIGKGETNAGFARCSSAATAAGASLWHNARDVT